MTKLFKLITASIIIALIVMGCTTNSKKDNGDIESLPETSSGAQETKESYPDETQPKATDETNESKESEITDPAITDPTEEEIEEPIDYDEIKPDESGKIMIVMFHNFISEYKSGDKEYTMTFGQFEELLQKLYDMGYSLISLSDYANNTIDVPAGRIPMVFTFDDASSGQFNLIEEDGSLVVNPQSAVAIMEKFYEKNPDFGLEGTFFVNLGLNPFPGEGKIEDRLNYLIDKGFEIGNHTLTHAWLPGIEGAELLQKEIGGNNKKMMEIMSGYELEHFSIPYGAPASSMMQYLYSGEYEGIEYNNKTVLEVGWDPAPSPISTNYNPRSIPRVRAPGIEPVFGDLNWWLERLSRQEQYVSDGNPKIISVPEARTSNIHTELVENLDLVIY